MALAETHLSFRSRLGHLALLLAAAGMGTMIAALLATETALPGRTIIAFWLMLAISLAWTGYAVWVLTARRTLLANHRVVAGWIGTGAAAIFTLGAAAIGLTMQAPAAWAAGALGLVLLGIAGALLLRAQRQYRALQARRQALEDQLKAG
jgi:hypothetical protein